MAPEILTSKSIKRKADIWSLGCMIIEMAVGGNPWGNELFDNYFDAILKVADPNRYPTIPEDLSTDCKDFIRKCLTRDYN
jgi:serine/threonine protein kinase